MLSLCFYILLYLFNSSLCYLKHTPGWHCRDNSNKPVEWWFMYKPPRSTVDSTSGLNFSYISPDEPGRWINSEVLLTHKNMLKNTLVPYHKSFNNVAYISLDQPQKPGILSTPALRAFLLAEEGGGIYISHTVPKFPDKRAFSTFPHTEEGEGHLLWCLSLTLGNLNEIVTMLRRAGAKATHLRVPNHMLNVLKPWLYSAGDDGDKMPMPLPRLEFPTRVGTLIATLTVRQQGRNNCLYTEFAARKGIVLDVYAPGITVLKNTCQNNFSVRIINQLCVKSFESVYYVNNIRDRARFAVSTAASWQKKGTGAAPQYWTCMGNLAKDDDSQSGGYLLCVHNYQVWSSFDSLKVNEPSCYFRFFFIASLPILMMIIMLC